MTSSHAIPHVALRALCVRYGRALALDRVSLAVEPGQVYALLGRNGSGKTSLVRCLLGQQAPSAGAVDLFGEGAWAARHRLMHRVGVVPEEPDTPPQMSARQVLHFCSGLYRTWDGAGALARLQRFGLPLDLPAGRLSRGQKAQLALALALAPRPDLLVLDDPTLGLDAVARREVYDEVLGDLADRGTTVFITTHDLGGIEGIADRVGILQGGRLVVDADLAELKARYRRLSWTQGSGFGAGDLGPLAPLCHREHALGGEAVVAGDAVALEGLALAGVESHSLSLEELFIALVGSETEVAS